MELEVTISPTLNGRRESYTITFLENAIQIQGKHVNRAEYSGQNWHYAHKSYGDASVRAMANVLEVADFPARLPDALVLWWNQWKEQTRPESEILADLDRLEALLEKVTSACSFLY